MLRHYILLLCTLAVGGCTSTTRPCPGFGTPLADMWSTARDIGDTVNYVNDVGATVALELRFREDSEPYEGSSSNGSDEVTCGSNSVRQYVFDSSDAALQFTLEQTHSDDPSREAGQSFSLRIRPESPVGEEVGYYYGFFLGLQSRQGYTQEFVLDNDTDTGPKASRYIENLQIGNNIYPYAVEEKFADVTPITNLSTDLNPFSAIVRVIVAEGGGLVQFELLNGEVYSRI